jgi:ribosomal protein S13
MAGTARAIIVNVDNSEEIGSMPAHIMEDWQVNEKIRSAPLTEEQVQLLSNYLQREIVIGYAFFRTDRILVGLK